MRILHVNKFLYRRGGAEAYMLELADMQRQMGHEVEFFGMQHPSNSPMTYQRFFPSYVEFEPAPPELNSRVRLAARMVWSRQARSGMAEVLGRVKPDVVHLHNIYHQLSPSVLAPLKATGTPAVMTLHDYKLACPTYQLRDSNPRSGKATLCTACLDKGVWQAAKRACKDGSRAASSLAALEVGIHRLVGAYEPVQAFVCPSTFLKDVMTRAGVFPDRMQVLDNFTEIPPKARSGPGSGIVYFGRLSSEKGVDTLIEAFGQVNRRIPDSKIALRIAGEGPERESLERQARGTLGDIRFHGRLGKAELAQLISTSRASVVPSRWHENQPLSVLESLALGVPVVATNLGGLPDIVRDGVTGLLVNPDSPAELATALEQYVLDPELAIRHGRAARNEAEQRFDQRSHADQVMSIYQAAADRLHIARSGGRS